MATKKQKRAAALARREKFMAEYRADGLKALERDRRRRQIKAERAKEDEAREERRQQARL